MTYVKNNENDYQNIYITTHLNDTKQYIYYLFYTRYNPLLYQERKHVAYHSTSDGWVSIDAINNIHFVSSLSEVHMQKNDLLISHPSDFAECKGIFEVKDRVGYGLFQATTVEQFFPCITTQ